ncbi:hypothetical protein AB833_11290 [Chromatiales bacterium (ex Bugula neritina AB1)]|nr:hypothetical protein AB833_11290 [Chromatiales bacterium (ex Bugula neritina AB1)]
MITPYKITRRYRRYRFYNQDAYRSLFLALDVSFFLIKVAVIAGLLLLAFKLYSNYSNTQNTTMEASATLKSPSIEPGSAGAGQTTDPSENTELPEHNETTALISTPKTQSIDTESKPLETGRWVLEQDNSKYTIQFGSSPDRQLLIQDAQQFDSTEPMAIYVFKRTPTNRPVYGLARGVYDSLDHASQSLTQLPPELKIFDPWIRPINKLQDQIRDIGLQ